jgi:hypothetical protein
VNNFQSHEDRNIYDNRVPGDVKRFTSGSEAKETRYASSQERIMSFKNERGSADRGGERGGVQNPGPTAIGKIGIFFLKFLSWLTVDIPVYIEKLLKNKFELLSLLTLLQKPIL